MNIGATTVSEWKLSTATMRVSKEGFGVTKSKITSFQIWDHNKIGDFEEERQCSAWYKLDLKCEG